MLRSDTPKSIDPRLLRSMTEARYCPSPDTKLPGNVVKPPSRRRPRAAGGVAGHLMAPDA
jgi:hypothetical protein